MKKRRLAEPFDVTEFLRHTDSDLRSALKSMIMPSQETAATAIPGLNLVPDVNIGPGTKLIPGSILDADANLRPGTELIPGLDIHGMESVGTDRKPVGRRFTIREALTAADGHSRAEQQVYETLWKVGSAQPDGSRVVRIGMLTLARQTGLSESNTRLNLRSLERKLAIEQVEGFVCESSQGRTWKIHSTESILARRRQLGLNWYMKRTLKVVFVDRETGDPLLS